MPEIIAHRGASREFIENSLEAFRHALDEQADAVELDVHLSSDGVVVVHHDPNIRDAGTGTQHRIRTTTFELLQRIHLPNGESVPTLDDVFELIGGRAVTYVEVKASGMEQQVVDCCKRHPEARVAVHSFDHRIPVRARRLLPTLPIGFLSASYPLDVSALLADADIDDFWQLGDLIDAPLVEAVNRMGARVVAWTVDDPGQAKRLVHMGVSAICTNLPGLMRASLTAG